MAELVGEPHWLSLEAIGGMTDRQILDLYHHPRDEQGRLKARARGARELTQDEADAKALAMAVALGCSQDQIQALKRKIADRKAGRPPAVERSPEAWPRHG